MRYVIQTTIAAALLLGIVALVTHVVNAQSQPDPSTAMRCDPVTHPYCPDLGPDKPPTKKKIVTYDRSPEQRPGEKYSRYQDRRYFVEHFDRFVEQSNVSKGQVQQVLLALYDYQEQESALLKSMDERAKSTYDGSLCPDPHDGSSELAIEYFSTLQRRLDSILTPKQMRVWEQTCLVCYSRVGYYHDDHILKLQEK